MIWKEIFGAQTVSPSSYEAQHDTVLSAADALGSLSLPNNPGHLSYNSGHLPRRTQHRLAAPSATALAACGVSWCSRTRSEIGKALEQCS